jgi:hypothetical protein
MNLGELIERWAKETPKKTALVYEGKETSFLELNRNVNRLANGLRSLGIQKGDRIAIMLPNTPEFIYGFFACLKLGAVAVPFNTMYKGGEIIHILQDCEAKAIITLTNFVSLINEIKPEVPGLEHIITTGERTTTFADPASTIFVQAVLAKNTFKNLDEAYRDTGEALVEGFQELGLKGTWYKHRGSLRIGGKKLAGFLISEVENIYILNMVCFLGRFRPGDFFSVIWVPPEVKDKILEPLTSAEEEIGRIPTDEEFKTAVIKSLEKRFGITLKEGSLSRDEKFSYQKQRSIALRK